MCVTEKRSSLRRKMVNASSERGLAMRWKLLLLDTQRIREGAWQDWLHCRSHMCLHTLVLRHDRVSMRYSRMAASLSLTHPQ